MMGIYVIDGKPSAYASLISALVRKAGHKLRVGYDETKRMGWATIVRCDDPDFTFRSEWDLDRALTAELCTLRNGEPYAVDKDGKSKPWKKFFPSMTKARAITEVARDACEEALFGLHYTPEELGAEVDDEGRVIGGVIVGDNPGTAQPPSDDTWYVRPPGAAAAEDDWLKQAEERASSFTTQEEGKKLWAEVMARWNSGQIRTEDSDRLSALMKARRAALAKGTPADAGPDDADVVDAEVIEDAPGPDPTSVPTAGTQDAEPARPGTDDPADLDPADPWAAKVECIADLEEADAALADLGLQLENGTVTEERYLVVSAAIDRKAAAITAAVSARAGATA
jgi:hypothetical protein